MLGRRVLVAGKFDILHLGHIAYLEQARDLAGPEGEVIVVIARDSTILKERGAPPVFPAEQRRRIVESLKMVDTAIIGYDTEDQSRVVIDIRPDILALGYDQRADIERIKSECKKIGLATEIVRLEKKEADGLCSSTLIRKRIIDFYRENGTAR